MLTNWEFSRKIRAPHEETSYTTYSKLWGPQIATLVALTTQIIFFGCGLYLIQKISGNYYWLLLLLPTFLMMMAYILFMINPNKSFPFKKLAENQILNIVLALLIVVIWGYQR